MNHTFDIDEAVKYGVEKAVLINNMRFWLTKNKANDKNVHDGYYWTFNSSKALAELFPYMNTKSISRWMLELEKTGLLKSSANYNKMKFDRTKHYTIPSEFSVAQNEECITQAEETITQNEETIPYINTNINTDKKNKQKLIDEAFEIFWTDYPKKINKPNAKKTLAKYLKSGITIEKICEAMNKSEPLRNPNPQYIPNPQAWLNSEPWEDGLFAPMGASVASKESRNEQYKRERGML